MEFEVKSSQIKATERESRRTWNFVLEVQDVIENLHFGLAIYQVPALDRRPAKLENYPIVVVDSKCISWSAKAY
jgi:hypothetical protein